MSAFPEIDRIDYEGPDSKNPLAFRHYNPEELVEGKRMRDHLRFSVAYWHSFRATGTDPFGSATMLRPWDNGDGSVENAIKRVHVAFEFMEKLGVPYYCFHDRDVAPESSTLTDTNRNFEAVAKVLKEEQDRTGIQLLWGTANLFSHPRYLHGAATSCHADSFAFAAAQVKKAMEITYELGGEGYVFWGGREGYQTLWNTDMKREVDNLARFMHMAVEHKQQLGFQGPLYFEPKPKEPTKHQYDFDAANCINFIRAYGLEEHVKLNIETNHATLAGHEMAHELEYAASQGFLGSVDANTGDLLLGWDTDQFPTDLYLTTKVMLIVLKYGGLQPGGLNFDAKVRRESFEPIDLFHAHIGGMDTFARGLKVAAAIRAEGTLDQQISHRYRSWETGIGQAIEQGNHSFESLEKYALEKGEVDDTDSGRQEAFENLVNRYIL